MNQEQILFLNSDILTELIKRKKAEPLYTEFTDEDRTFDIGDHEVIVDREYTNFNINDFNVSVITVNSYLFDQNNPQETYSKNCIRRKQEILTSLREGKTLILFVEKIDDLLINLMYSLNIEIKNIKNYTDEVETNLLKFRSFVERYCNATVGYVSDSITPICTFKGITCGFYQNFDKGKLYVIPVVMRDYSADFFTPLLSELFKNISSMDEEIKLPEYLNKERLIDEGDLLGKKAKYKKDIEQIDKALNKYNNIKSILFLKHDLLVDNIVLTLNEIGLETHRMERYEEDLWIMSGQRKEVIIEVKGTKKNFTRKQINDLDNHRDENSLAGDFPSLLIANTFSDAISFSEKDIPPEDDSLKRAKAQNIMIMRTLDLYNLYKLIKTNKIQITSFIDTLKDKDCGWIKVDNKLELIKNE